MARKKCKECLTCFNLVWKDSKRYYHCWFCNTWYEGRDDNLQLVPMPDFGNEEVELKEQDDNLPATADIQT